MGKDVLIVGVSMTNDDKRFILEYAKNNMNGTKKADTFFLHRNTVEYRLKRIKAETKLDPKNFFDLVKLVQMAGGLE